MGNEQARDPMAGEQASTERAVEQQAAGDWPKPGEEGYVHPDGTPQAAAQLAANRQAAQDRAAAGSIVHGAPTATPGQDPGVSSGLAVQRAEEFGGPSVDERDEKLTETVRAGQAEAAQVDPASDSTPERPGQAGQRTASDSKPRRTS